MTKGLHKSCALADVMHHLPNGFPHSRIVPMDAHIQDALLNGLVHEAERIVIWGLEDVADTPACAQHFGEQGPSHLCDVLGQVAVQELNDQACSAGAEETDLQLQQQLHVPRVPHRLQHREHQSLDQPHRAQVAPEVVSAMPDAPDDHSLRGDKCPSEVNSIWKAILGASGQPPDVLLAARVCELGNRRYDLTHSGLLGEYAATDARIALQGLHHDPPLPLCLRRDYAVHRHRPPSSPPRRIFRLGRDRSVQSARPPSSPP
mmetsp:Transcript_152712/g.388043  ORF Transcript_152712/g.388043 Transcript_152712/m.388043 type:complete len:261 (+) Transcript_152712:236-1018(+)